MSDSNDDNPDVAAAASSPGTIVDTSAAHEEPVLIHEAAGQEEADVIRATLLAAGIRAIELNPDLNAGAGMMAETVGATWRNGIYVAPADVEAARAVLNAPPPTEEELAAEEEADPTTLEEAEARVKNG